MTDFDVEITNTDHDEQIWKFPFLIDVGLFHTYAKHNENHPTHVNLSNIPSRMGSFDTAHQDLEQETGAPTVGTGSEQNPYMVDESDAVKEATKDYQIKLNRRRAWEDVNRGAYADGVDGKGLAEFSHH